MNKFYDSILIAHLLAFRFIFFDVNMFHSFSCTDGNKIYVIKNGYTNDSKSNTSRSPISDIPNFENSSNSSSQQYNSTSHTTPQMSDKRIRGHWKQILPASISTPPNNESTAILQNFNFTQPNPPSSTASYFSGKVEVH